MVREEVEANFLSLFELGEKVKKGLDYMKNKEKMIPAMMALEEMAKATPAVMKKKKMTTPEATVMLVYVSTLTLILLEK